jgi:hypothetical protein
MKTITYSNGFKATYDDQLKEGDLITTYWKGYYTFIRFEERPNTTPEACFKKAYNFNGSPCKSKKTLQCDAAYCRKAVDHIRGQIKQKKQEIMDLEQIIQE